jgi:hypothetical protein
MARVFVAIPLNLFFAQKTPHLGRGPEERPVSLLTKQLIDYRREGIIAARVTALAGLMIGCWLFLVF